MLPPAVSETPRMDEKQNRTEYLGGPGWRGALQILSTVPTVDWVLLGSGESNKG